MASRTFKEAFCESRRCSPAAFEEAVFWRCLYRRAIPLALLIKQVNPRFFGEDIRTIQQAGLGADLREIRAVLDDFAYINRARRHWLRTGLRVRVSGKRLRALAEEAFSKPEA